MKTLVIMLLLSTSAFANDKEAYCRSEMEAALAQRDVLRTPNAVAGVTQPNTGLPMQTVFGFTTDLSNIRKAGLTMQAARTNCQLYSATVDAQRRIYYALPAIEKEVLRHRLDLIQQASDKLDALIADNMKMVVAQNLTRPAVHVLQSAKIRLDTSRTAAMTGIVSPYVPPLDNDRPLRELVSDKLADESANQESTVKLEKQNSWNVNISVGAHRQIASLNLPNSSPVGAYGEFSVTYGLGRHSADNHLDSSARAYSDWKETQFDDVAQQAAVLKQQIIDTIAIQKSQLEILIGHEADLDANLKEVCDTNTTGGIAFRNELMADKIVLGVDIDDVQFRFEKLTEYLNANF